MQGIDRLLNRLTTLDTAVAVVGLGYVGLPLAACLAKRFRTIGFDIDRRRVDALAAGRDDIAEVATADLTHGRISFTADPAALAGASVIIIAVPTPVDSAKRPDMRALESASTLVGKHLTAGSIVVYESTVYPGATEEVCVPILERASGLSARTQFGYGYSPERINPGDRTHTIDSVVKVVSGCDPAVTEVIAGVYGAAIAAGVFRAASVRVAEAAKVIENTQRDLNIALINELALIFHRLGIDTGDVLATARTKWNFLDFRPGLVGGHCIGVDPYYLTHKAQQVGYHPEVILAGRRTNDGMGAFVAQECVRLLIAGGRHVRGARVLVLGMTFKEDCADVRNSRVIDIIDELKRFGAHPVVHDPVADARLVHEEYHLDLVPLAGAEAYEAVVLAVAHQAFRALDLGKLAAMCAPKAPLLDVKSLFPAAAVEKAGFVGWKL
ncbi:MAG: nucleotide sugar dehydrogenase [Planctomycetes bacterium]|nr:nucleotide sugar dehydrogenase [Planctomycetota bacterium]